MLEGTRGHWQWYCSKDHMRLSFS